MHSVCYNSSIVTFTCCNSLFMLQAFDGARTDTCKAYLGLWNVRKGLGFAAFARNCSLV